MKLFDNLIDIWGDMLMQNPELQQQIREDNLEEIPVLHLSSSIFPELIPKTRCRCSLKGHIGWTLHPDGLLTAKGIGTVDVIMEFTPDLSWKIEPYVQWNVLLKEGFFPNASLPDISFSENTLNILEKNQTSKMLYSSEKLHGFRTNLLDISHFGGLCIKGPHTMYSVETINSQTYRLNPLDLLEQYTGRHQQLFVHQLNEDSYESTLLIDRNNFHPDVANKNLQCSPVIVRYLAEVKKYDWAKQEWEKQLAALDDLKLTADHAMTTEQQKIIFLQDCLQKYWKEIMTEMNEYVPDNQEDFSVPVWKWKLNTKNINFHHCWMGYIDEYKQYVNQEGYFSLLLPERVTQKNEKEFRAFLKEFTWRFCRVLIEKEAISFGFYLDQYP